MTCLQKTFKIRPFKRGFHLITKDIMKMINLAPELANIKNIKAGIGQLFIHHTSASLTINENADPTVRVDFESHFNQIVPENQNYYTHTLEGSDDMPAHLKASILGSSVNFPIKNGNFLLGTWQGIYLCEHRNYANERTLTLTIFGE